MSWHAAGSGHHHIFLVEGDHNSILTHFVKKRNSEINFAFGKR